MTGLGVSTGIALAWLSCAVLLVAVPAVALLAGAQSEIVQVSRSGRGAYEASLAPHAGGFVVAWHDTRHGRPEIYARRVDAGGRPLADEHRLTRSTARSYEPSIAMAARDGADDFIVAWYDVAADDSSSVARVGVRGLRWHGTKTWSRRAATIAPVVVPRSCSRSFLERAAGARRPVSTAAGSGRHPAGRRDDLPVTSGELTARRGSAGS